MAKALAGGGAAVAIQDIDESVAKAEADAIVAAGGRAIGLGGDLTDLTVAERLVEQTVAAFGPIDVLVNNGSIQHQSPFLEQTLENMQREMNANVLTPTRLCQLVLPSMMERKWGRIINLSSIQAKGGNSGMAAYAMTRAALENLTKSLGHGFAKHNITVNCLSPGYFNTFRNKPADADRIPKEVTNGWVPLGRCGEPEDCAGITLLLCSQAGEYITGQILHVDGGMSI
jgi:2-deoxy-D-gluconate 3-dehydrogenase